MKFSAISIAAGRSYVLPQKFKKVILVMKLTSLLLFIAFLQVSAKGYSQIITLKETNVSLATVLKSIKKQTGYFVFYEDNNFETNKVTIDVKDASLDDVLNLILKNQPLAYKIVDKNIFLTVKDDNQITEIKGQVVDERGIPLKGASISVKDHPASVTSTNDKGEFDLKNINENTEINVSYVGMVSQTIKIGNQSNITITLLPDSKELNSVVVIGYGTQKKKDLTGAVSVIGSKELEERANTEFGYAIEGKAAGVQVIRSSGQPQAGFSIKIRGTSSITSGADPLYIVDDVPTYNTNEINPADIETITVLKDAASAAIYGTSGANGVVLITTKRGKKNQKSKITYEGSLMSSSVWKKLDVLNSTQYEDLMTEMGIGTDFSKYTANTDWQNLVFRNSLTQSHNISMSGGNENTTYFMSGSYIDQNGIVINNFLKRFTYKLNLDHTVSKLLKVGTSVSYDEWKDKSVPENSRNGVLARLITASPIIGVWNPALPNQYATSPIAPVDVDNPVATAYQPDNLYSIDRFLGNAYAELSFTPWLKFKSLFGLEHSNSIYTSFENSIQTIEGRTEDGVATETDNNYNYWISQNTLNFNKSFGDHNFSLLGGFIVSNESNRSLAVSSHGFGGSSAITTVTAGTIQAVPQVDIYDRSHVSFIGRFNYDYQDKYLFTSNFRADGSGEFSPQNRWGYFPSLSAGWRISKEPFFKDITAISDLKIRAGWGLVGNDRANPYAWYGLLTPTTYVIGDNSVNAVVPSTQENANLKWEKTAQTDIGVDVSLLHDRITLAADYYLKKTTDLLLYAPIPASEGTPGNTALQNAGSIQNKGFEFQLSTKNIVTDNFLWSSDFNISFNRGKVLNIIGTTIYSGDINPAGSTYSTAIVKAGLPLGSFYGKYAEGVDPATGNEVYLKNKAGADSLGVIGNANPDFTYGFTNSLRYKSFSLTVFLQGSQGNQIFDATKILTESMSDGENQSSAVLNRWEKPGDITTIPKSTLNDQSNVYPSTRFIENGSYLRVKSVTFGYSLPASFLSKLKIVSCKLYVTAENLLTITKYSGFDPEVSVFSASNQSSTDRNAAPGVDFGTYPQSRDFILGINVTL